jgi:hypothetical protein
VSLVLCTATNQLDYSPLDAQGKSLVVKSKAVSPVIARSAFFTATPPGNYSPTKVRAVFFKKKTFPCCKLSAHWSLLRSQECEMQTRAKKQNKKGKGLDSSGPQSKK